MDTACPAKDVFLNHFSMKTLLVSGFQLWHVD